MEQKDSIDPSVVPYLRQADATFQNGFDDNEMRTLFIDNVFEEIKGSEAKLSVMKSSCFIVEQFANVASASCTLQLLQAFSNDIEDVSTSQQGCHVLQTTLQRVILLKNTGEISEEMWSSMCETLIKCSSLLKRSSTLSEWMCDTYATHVARSMFETLGGVIFANPKQASNKLPGVSSPGDVILAKKDIPKSFRLRLKKIVSRFCELNRQSVAEILTNPSGSPCICILLKTVAHLLSKTQKKLCEKLMEVGGNENSSTLVVLAKDKMGSRVLEALLEYGDQASFDNLHMILTADHEKLIELSTHPVANFVIQKLVSSPRINDKFSDLFGVLCSSIEELYGKQKFGVIQKLAEQCVAIEPCQRKFMEKLKEAFNCKDENKKFFVPLIATFKPYTLFMKNCKGEEVPQLTNVTYHGSLLLQTLLRFKKTKLITDSLLEIPISHSVALACHASGSHLIDAFLTSQCVKLKIKKQWIGLVKVSAEMLLSESYTLGQSGTVHLGQSGTTVFFNYFGMVFDLQNTLHEFACHKHGSRVVDTIWKVASVEVKTLLAEELSKHEETLLADLFGKHVYRNMGLRQFRLRKNEWMEFQERQSKKRKMFSDIVDDFESKKAR